MKTKQTQIHQLLAAAMAAMAAGFMLGAGPDASTAPATAPATSTRPATPGWHEAADKASAVRSNAAGAINNGWVTRHTGFVTKAKAGGIDLYMEGDSITDFWQTRFKANWDKNLGSWKPGDFGISGDRTQNVLYRVENGELDGVNPKVVVLLIGTNNLATNAAYADNTVEETAAGVKAVVDAIHKKAPDAKILLMAIFPRNDPPPKPGPDIWGRICRTNALIEKLADGKATKYLNINDKLADKDGNLLPGVMGADNLHPSDKGYQIWFDAMKPVLTEWLGEVGVGNHK